MQPLRQFNLCKTHGKHVLQIPAHRGEELFLRLASEGIDSTVVRKPGSLMAHLEMDEDVNLESVQSVLRAWDR